jgi:hypothetical protein
MRQKEFRSVLRERWALCHASFCTTTDLLYSILGMPVDRIIHPWVLPTTAMSRL